MRTVTRQGEEPRLRFEAGAAEDFCFKLRKGGVPARPKKEQMLLPDYAEGLQHPGFGFIVDGGEEPEECSNLPELRYQPNWLRVHLEEVHPGLPLEFPRRHSGAE